MHMRWTYDEINDRILNSSQSFHPNPHVHLNVSFQQPLPRAFLPACRVSLLPCRHCSRLNASRPQDSPMIPCIVSPGFDRCGVCIKAHVSWSECGRHDIADVTEHRGGHIDGRNTRQRPASRVFGEPTRASVLTSHADFRTQHCVSASNRPRGHQTQKFFDGPTSGKSLLDRIDTAAAKVIDKLDVNIAREPKSQEKESSKTAPTCPEPALPQKKDSVHDKTLEHPEFTQMKGERKDGRIFGSQEREESGKETSDDAPKVINSDQRGKMIPTQEADPEMLHHSQASDEEGQADSDESSSNEESTPVKVEVDNMCAAHLPDEERATTSTGEAVDSALPPPKQLVVSREGVKEAQSEAGMEELKALFDTLTSLYMKQKQTCDCKDRLMNLNDEIAKLRREIRDQKEANEAMQKRKDREIEQTQDECQRLRKRWKKHQESLYDFMENFEKNESDRDGDGSTTV